MGSPKRARYPGAEWDETSLGQGYGSAGEIVPPFRQVVAGDCVSN
jgi:hypothetical protein